MSESNGCGIQIVRRELLEALAAEAPVSPSASTNGRARSGTSANSNGTANGSHANNGSGDYPFLFVDRWLQDRGVEYRVKPQPDNKGRTVYVLKKCPFDSSHGDPDSCVMQEPCGRMSAKCLHSSCAGRGWQEFKDAIGSPGGEHYDAASKTKGRGRQGSGQKASAAAPIIAPPPAGKACEAFDDPHLLARTYRAQFRHAGHLDTLFFHRQEWFRWGESAYRVLEEKEIKAELTENVKTAFDRHNLKQLAVWADNGSQGNPPTAPKVTTKLIGNAAQALTGMALLSSKIETPAWLSGCDDGWAPSDILACKNALLHLPSFVAGLHHSISPTPLFFSPNALDYDFDPAALLPANWLAFLQDLWPNDPAAVEALQEWFGYCLLPDTSQHKILMIVGPRRSGKGTIARVLRAIVGTHNMASPTLASLSTNFGLQPLLNKTLAIISDARLSYRTDAAVVVERLLSISGEDPQTIDRKHKAPITLKLPVRFLVLTNELPRLNDPSGALVGRLILLRQTKSFYGSEDTTLTDRLLAESPGILLWAIEGWRRLRERGHFVQPESGTRLVQQMEDLSSPIGAFIRECCEIGPGFEVPCKELFARWEKWCEEKGQKDAGLEQVFGRDLRAAVPGIDTVQKRWGSMRPRFYAGIREREEEGSPGGEEAVPF